MDRSAALALLRAHRRKALAPVEALAADQTIVFAEEHADCLLRTCKPGHLTGSAWVVSPDRKRALLTHHLKLGKWLQLGGHADGDPDLLRVALREAREESGLSSIRALDAGLYDVDRHWIGEQGAEPGHWHHDLRFLFEADPDEPLVVSGESRALAWVGLADVGSLNPEESMARMVAKSPRP